MATVTTTVTSTLTRFPYSGPRNDESIIPLAEIRAAPSGGSTSVAATGAGDNQFVTQTITLPQNYAYALVDLEIEISGAGGGAAINFPQAIFCRFSNAASSASLLVPIEVYNHALARFASVNVPAYVYSAARLPQLVMKPEAGDAAILELQAFNTTANDGAYTWISFARFLQYSLDQAFDYRVNTPLPVR